MKRSFLTLALAAILFSGLAVVPASVVRAEGNSCLAAEAPGCTNGLPTDVYQRLLGEMQAHPSPDVMPIPADMKEVRSYSFFRVLPDTTLHDSPNGNPVGKMEDGFTFVSVYAVKDGFAQLRNKLWVRRDSLKQTYSSQFTGVLLDKPLAYPMAWVIQASIPSSYPGGPRTIKTPAINRYTRVNLFATVNVDGWDWFLVGPGQWLEQRKLARIMPATNPGTTGKWVAINLYEQVLSAYDGDRLVYATLISSGLPNFQTNKGTFKVWHRALSTPMSGAMGQPDFYSLPAVPYVMFFDNDISLHGTYWHDGFGFKHSHGCVNMSIADARWLYEWSGDSELTVLVWDSHAA
jgi:hypothetical protein